MNLEQIFARLKSMSGGLSASQISSLVFAFVAVVALVAGSAYYLNRASYVLLFSDMDAESASSVAARLKTMKVPYQIADGGRAIRVPETRVDELRLEFASQGLPASGRIGFEIFDRVAFGATEFQEQVQYRRALEGEITRTISTLAEVSGARVHIVPAKRSVFESRQEPAKASVILKLRGNRPLPAPTAQGICSLVAASVEGLRPESVVLVDSFGRPLVQSRESQDSPTGVGAMERQLAVERDLTAKVLALLEPVVGTGRVRVNVAVRLNAQTEEQTEERWDPASPVVRSRAASSDSTSAAAAGGLPGVGGPAGARANLPDPAANPAQPAPPPAAPDTRLAGRTSETTNYEVSRTTRHTIRPNGEIARLSVAVILDDEQVTSTDAGGVVKRATTPRAAGELQKIQNLVTAAVGLDPARGDQLTVENVAFDERPAVEDAPEPRAWERYAPQALEVGRIAAVLILGLLAVLTVVRPVVKRVLSSPMNALAPASALRAPAALPRTVKDLEGAIEAELDATSMDQGGEHRKIPALSRRLGSMTQKEPEHAARLVRTWIQDERR